MNNMIKRCLWAALALAALAADSALTYRLATARSVRTASAASVREPADALQSFRLEREQLRAREEAQLNEIIYSDGSGELAGQARQRLMDMLDRAEAENTLEGVLRARGFDDAVVTVGERSANVLLRREAPLNQRETAVILELVMRETGLTGGSVKIIPVK